jgi:hypothetical protein
MNRRRQAVLGVLAAVALPYVASVTPSAVAGITQTREPVTFTLTPEVCPALAVTVQGSGERFIVTNQWVDKNGVVHIVGNDLATGTAVDSEGATYVFNYHQHFNPIAVPPEGFPVTFLVNDHFNLVGKGKAARLHVSFVYQVTFPAPDQPPTTEVINERGDPACDPI